MRAMKTLVISAVAVLGLLATTQVANATSHVKATKKQKITFTVTGDCKDEEEMIEDESKDNCKIVVKISPTTPTRTAILEQLNDDDEWEESASARSKAGKITFSIDATDEDDAWLDGDFTFQVTVKKSVTNKAVVSDEYTFTFTPAESSSSADEGSGSGSAKQKSKSTRDTKLDAVLDNMDNKNTTYDDNCKTSYGEDCKLMFTSTGPNWSQLSAAKWQPMCEKLLKQTAANCALMYGKSAPPPGSGSKDSGAPSKDSGAPSKDSGAPSKDSGGSGGQPSSGGSGGQPPSGGSSVRITEEDIKKACTAAVITDCDSVIKLLLGPTKPSEADMVKLLGSKMAAFFKAMPQQPN